jgi:hypothetical protein
MGRLSSGSPFLFISLLNSGKRSNNWDLSFSKETKFTERRQMEFRADIFNVWVHAQFYKVDGNISNQGGPFGQVPHIRDPFGSTCAEVPLLARTASQETFSSMRLEPYAD